MENREGCIFKYCFVFPRGPFVCLPTGAPSQCGRFVYLAGILLDCFTGREAYFNLQKSERNMEELKKSYKGGASGLQVSEEDLTGALGR